VDITAKLADPRIGSTGACGVYLMKAATFLFCALIVAPALMGAPMQDGDDWPTASAHDSDLVSEKLATLASDIRGGKFAKIGSVLLARHGRLVYEEYFDGGPDTLRDTRSATKSITDILIGIAIDEHKLSDVHARVLNLLPERKRRIQNPEPRKDSIKL
jgi:CubicO group peptidase (beta-lactamase class C family)